MVAALRQAQGDTGALRVTRWGAGEVAVMETTVAEIAPDIYRFSTFNPQAGIAFCQFLIDADEPLLFHTGQSGSSHC